MVANLEVVVAEEWLYEVLDAAFTEYGYGNITAIYAQAGPQEAAYPFIVFAYLSGSDVFGVGPARYLTGFDYKVVVADRQESWATMLEAAQVIDDALHGAKGSPSGGGTVLSCVRTEPFVQREVLDGITYASLGGVYHIQVQG